MSEKDPKFVKPGWYKKTENLLKRCSYLPIEIASMKEQLENIEASGVSITPAYTKKESSNHEVSIPTANYVEKVMVRKDKIARMESTYNRVTRAINALTEEEKVVYELRYIKCAPISFIWEHLGKSKTVYYEFQNEMILKVAKLIGEPLVIVPDDDIPWDEWKGDLFESMKKG